jgi:transcriptional regulator with XRE-family HTH domain
MRVEERIGARVREERRKKGWSQEVLGEAISRYLPRPWSAQTVSNAENGGRDFAAQDMLALALVLGVPVAAFYREAVETAGQKIVMPSGVTVDETAMRRVYGSPNSEAHRIAHNLEKVVAEVRLLGEGE